MVVRKKQKTLNKRSQQKLEQSKPQTQEREVADDGHLLTFGGHLEVFRQMLFRILGVVALIAGVVFCFKDITWQLLLAPSEWDFCTYRWLEQAIRSVGIDFHFEAFHVDMIATDLSSQFMMHISTAVYLGLLGASPYILYELFRFISPALYENERKYSVQVAGIIYALFILGVLMSYFVLFPISFRFLGTYSVSERVVSNITLDSYISTFISLTLIMGVVFQLPVIAFFLGKMGIVTSSLLANYRRHSFIGIMLVAAIITPPDIMTLILVAIPLYLLYEVSIRVVKWTEPKDESL
ncbi:MAG: twin-arginine translocase subunit TatC [Bacteroidaceae bacterium]|nr:twin-arginine translocase subunit TatC [Bacteroidaceae bacterium]